MGRVAIVGLCEKKDLPFFLKEIADIEYEYRVELAPTNDILKPYKNNQITWAEYENSYKSLIHRRNLDHILQPDELEQACFLCACQTAHHCHNRLLADYLNKQWNGVLNITHL